MMVSVTYKKHSLMETLTVTDLIRRDGSSKTHSPGIHPWVVNIKTHIKVKVSVTYKKHSLMETLTVTDLIRRDGSSKTHSPGIYPWVVYIKIHIKVSVTLKKRHSIGDAHRLCWDGIPSRQKNNPGGPGSWCFVVAKKERNYFLVRIPSF